MYLLPLFLLLLFGIMVYLIWNFPWLTKYYMPIIYKERIPGSKIIVFSDTHIRKGTLPETLTRFIIKEKFDIVVVAGDLLEYGHRKISREELRDKLTEVFDPILSHQFVGQIFYVTSTSTHDPKIENVEELILRGVRMVVIPGVLILENTAKYYVTHGDYASRNGAVSRILNKVSGLWIERKLRKILRVPDNAWLICGHTHIPKIDYKVRIANTGGWRKKLWIKPTCTVIIIDSKSNEVFLKRL